MKSILPHSPPSSVFNADLQALRGLAIFFVIYYHMLEMIPGLKASLGMAAGIVMGGQGVDLFFVVSGYVITKSMYRHIDHPGRVDFRDGLRFWVRRACRTLPPALIWLAFVLAIALYTGWYGAATNNLLHAKAAALQYGNFFNIYCGAQGTCGIFSYYWSLSLEEQFYLFLPIAMLVFTRRQLAALMLAGGLVSAIMLTKFIYLINPDVEVSAFAPLRTDGLMFGVSLALFEASKAIVAVKQFLNKHAASTLLFCLCAHIVLWTRGSPLPIFSVASYISSGTSAAVLVLIGISCQGRVIPNRKIQRGLVFLGNISFSLYLCHIIMIYSLQNYMGMHGYPLPSGAWYVPYVICLSASIVAVAWLSQRVIEAPFQRWGRKLSDEKMSSINFPAVPSADTEYEISSHLKRD